MIDTQTGAQHPHPPLLSAHPRTVLVVEDETDIRDVINVALTCAGHRVVTAESRDAALELLPQADAAVVIMDYYMPGLTAEEFIQQIRARHGAPLPIILMTASAVVKDSAHALGLTHFISKPFQIEELLTLVDAAR